MAMELFCNYSRILLSSSNLKKIQPEKLVNGKEIVFCPINLYLHNLSLSFFKFSSQNLIKILLKEAAGFV